MISISSDELARIHRAIFSVQRLKGMAHVLSVWMAHGTMSAWEGGAVSLPDCETVAQAYFKARPAQAALLPAYCAALQAARQLDLAMAEFLAQGAQGDLGALLARAGAALNLFAGLIDQVPEYPAAADDARALRSEAGSCLALLQPR
ncbi:hypothetical protein INH39_18815 [Massilia violaceinigra]|uniref:Uncharacterized protein n=1 Tax=Massilia violaceinigra TaxID=2045208 RepID=A0ABY3ZYX1_9BURK|nr:hypothetical protein [Massilia violaceinigra]UOD27567.1 hypothetical protein INH39_18815 [Massilia violaceinigra]